MKTTNTTSMKDSIGAMAIIGCIFATAIASVASSQHSGIAPSPAVIYKMDVIEVTAPRIHIEKLETIVVTASRI